MAEPSSTAAAAGTAPHEPPAVVEHDEANGVSYIPASLAADLDAEIMLPTGEYRFRSAQLMELAGLAVAQSFAQAFPLDPSAATVIPGGLGPAPTEVVVVCGPGNNGGDGFIAAHHLQMFGYPNVTIVAPRMRPDADPLLLDELQQARSSGVAVSATLPEWLTAAGGATSTTVDAAVRAKVDHCVVVDAIFGYSFRPSAVAEGAISSSGGGSSGATTSSIREPFGSMIQAINRSGVRVLSVDVPSGWHVDKGYIPSLGGIVNPTVLVSLMLPKLCAKHFQGRLHFLGGRFFSARHAAARKLLVPAFPASGAGFMVLPAFRGTTLLPTPTPQSVVTSSL